MTRQEVQQQFPAAVVEIDHREPAQPSAACLAEATVWAALLGERDPELVAPFASADGIPALQVMAMRELLRHPEEVIGSLTGQEASGAALVVLEHIQPSEALRRALGPLEPSVRASYGHLEHRAAHARAVLALVAADPDIRSRFAPGGAR